MLSVEDALARVLSPLSPLGAELADVAEAQDRVLAGDVMASFSQPPSDMSAMDGYALRADDAKTVPVTLDLIGESAAGHGFSGAVRKGQAVRIFTGAPLPRGADTVVIQENTERPSADRVTLLKGNPPGANIRPKGQDFHTGALLLRRARRLNARDLGLAAANNVAALSVFRRPRVAFLSTGDELVPAGAPLGPDQIVNSNAPMMAAFIRSQGGIPVDLGIARDNEADVLEAAQGFAGADLIVTMGGASVGDHDLILKVLAENGLEVDFWKIAMRPGKPLIHGRYKGAPFLGLPGNPVSALVCAHLFLAPMIARLSGQDWGGYRILKARCAMPLPANGPRAHYMRARLEPGADLPLVRAFDSQDSSLLSVLAMADALIVRPPDAEAADAGAIVEVMPL